MVSGMTLDHLTATHARYLGMDHADTEAALLGFIGRDSKPMAHCRRTSGSSWCRRTSPANLRAVLWQNKQGLDVTYFQLKPNRMGAEILVDIQQLILLPEAADYETKLKAQRQETNAFNRRVTTST